jgi:cytoskeletal protein CcmA (bactofilin family)
MWTDRKQDNSFGRSPGANPEPLADSAGKVSEVTVIGHGMVIKGAIVSNESLHIDGEVDGKLDMAEHRLTVGPQARVGADTRAREVEILGKFDGDIDAAKKITIRKGGSLVGDLRTPAIVIEDGAYFKGRIEIVNSDQRPQIVRPQPNVKKTASGS